MELLWAGCVDEVTEEKKLKERISLILQFWWNEAKEYEEQFYITYFFLRFADSAYQCNLSH